MPQYDPDRIRRQQEREAERARKAMLAREREREREQRQAYIEARKAEVAAENVALEKRLGVLDGLLVDGMKRAPVADFTLVRRTVSRSPLELGGLKYPAPEPIWEDFEPPLPGFWRKTFGSKDAEVARQEQARLEFARAQHEWKLGEDGRRAEIANLERRHEEQFQAAKSRADEVNTSLQQLADGVARREPAAIERYLRSSFKLVRIPDDFPRKLDLIFDSRHEHLVVEVEIPQPSCVPDAKTVRYVQSRDEIVRTARSSKEKAELYRGVVSRFCLLVAWSLLRSDRRLEQLSLNGRVRHINPATGHEERPHILSVVIDRRALEALNLAAVRPDECLRHLRALISPHPFELEAVQPLVDFDKSRIAFVEGLDAVSSLDSRPDLMAMSPTEFEHLVRQILDADPAVLSVESLTTRQSNDGGVDGVVYIRAPLGRSMTVVQAKQYVRTRAIGPDHVRELIGAMHQTRAGNGILVTTSTFTAGARTTAEEFGRIQLIDGNNLVHMIRELLHKEVLIGDRRSRS